MSTGCTPPPRSSSLNFERHLYTPETAAQIHELKRKASELTDQESPRRPSRFVEWRVLCLKSEIDLVEKLKEAASESYDKGLIKDEKLFKKLKGEADETQERLESEYARLLGEKKFIQEDLEDNLLVAEQGYIHELYQSLQNASRGGQKSIKRKKTIKQVDFGKLVGKYLDSEMINPETNTKMRWCCVLGKWELANDIKCAHIIPKSFAIKELDYMFGTNDAALESQRNGLMLRSTIEEAFDDGYIAIVPDGSVSATPTEWKVVVLDESKFKNQVHNNPRTTLKDIDGRRLSFRNHNRPARRYLYFRYTMAWIHADTRQFPGFKSKVPRGRIWASPNKPDGYLRGSVLRSLARRIGDADLPEELIKVGSFEDTNPPTGNKVMDELVPITIAAHIKKKISGELPKDDEDEDEEDDEE